MAEVQHTVKEAFSLLISIFSVPLAHRSYITAPATAT